MNFRGIQISIFFIVVAAVVHPVYCDSADRTEPEFKQALVISIPDNFRPFIFLNAEGSPAGLFEDIWRLWADKTGSKIEFLPADTWKTSVDNVRNKRADFHAGLFFAPEEYKGLGFSHPFYEDSVRFFFPVRHAPVSGIAELSGQPVGVIRGTAVEAYLKNRHPDIHTIAFDTREQMIYTAKDGKIRAFVSISAIAEAEITRLGLSGDFEQGSEILYTGKFCAGVLQENTRLIEWINNGFDAISLQELIDIEKRWIPDPAKRYFKPDMKKIRLTAAEQAWIRAHPVIKLGLFTDIEPAMFLGEDHTFQGIVKELIDIIGERAGVRFEIIPIHLDMRNHIPDMIQQGKLDVFPGFETKERKQYLNFTDPIYSISLVIVTRSETPVISGLRDLKSLNMTIACVRNTNQHEKIIKDYPDMVHIPSDSPSDALKLVSSGGADATILGLDVAAYLIRKHRLHNLKIAAPAGYPDLLTRFAVRKDFPELADILNKAIRTIDLTESDRIIQKWLPVRVEQAVDWSVVIMWSLGIGSIFIIILGVSLFWNRRLSLEIRQRRRVEESLRQAMDIVRNIQIGLYVCHLEDLTDDRTLRIVFANPAAETFTGVSNAHIVGRTVDENFPGLREKGIPQKYADVVRHQASCEFNDIHYHDHRVVFGVFYVKAFPLPNNHVGVCFENITKRWETEELIAREKQRFAMLLEAFPGYIYLQSPDYSIAYANDYFRRQFGDTKGRRCYELLRNRTAPCEECPTFEVFQTKTPKVWEWSQSPDGRIYLAYDFPFIDSDGTELVLEIGVDITDRKRAEETLQERETQLRVLGDNLPSAQLYQLMVKPDKNAQFTYISRQVENLYECTAEQALADPSLLFNRVVEEDMEGWRKAMEKSLAEMSVFDHTMRIRRKSGEIRWHRMISKPRASKDGVFFDGIDMDITPLRRAEEELRKAKEIAESATRAKSDFLAGMSHEIRTPMNAIVNLSKLLLETELNSEQRHYAQMVVESSDILLALINDILDFSKIEAGKLDLEIIDFDLPAVLHQLTKILGQKSDEKGLCLSCHIDENVYPHLIGDPLRLRQILMNLVGNAVKFTHKGEVKISVRAETQDKTSSVIRFDISDTGVGIPADRLDRLFKPFSQVDSSTTRKFGGSGLGLSISKQLVEMMGGEIGVESTEGVGSVFWFTVKLQHCECGFQTERPPEIVRHPEFKFPPELRILLVEDNPFNQQVALAILRKHNLSPDIANNGKEAVEIVRTKRYDLVLMDIEMPEMNGEEAAKIIRNSESENRNVPIIAMTAHAIKGSRKRFMDAGMNDFVTKPIDPKALFDAIRCQCASAEIKPEKAPCPRHDHHENREVFNRSDFLERMGGDEEIVKTLLEMIPEQLLLNTENLKAAVQRHQAEEIRHIAHTIKGMAANVSAGRLKDAAFKIETAGKQGNADAARALMNQLEQEVQQLLSVLASHLK